MHKNRIPKKQPLHVKILVGYILLTVLVVGIIAAVWYEKCVFQEAEQEERAMLEQRCLQKSYSLTARQRRGYVVEQGRLDSLPKERQTYVSSVR